MIAALDTFGVTAHGNGQVSLTGPALAAARDLDRAFLALASRWSPDEEVHPVLIAAATLERLDYFTSFPQLVTFPVTLDASDDNIEAFRQGAPVEAGSGTVRLATTSPVRDVLVPAACYHVYAHHEGEALAATVFVTTSNTCFRREEAYEPLRRQWSFTMREVVCLGAHDTVVSFLDEARAAVRRLCEAVGVDVGWETATDPFFRPSTNPKYLMQRIEPVKHEARTRDGLAIASVNLHHDHFGSLFDITHDGRPAVTGCLAFGVERWLSALLSAHGPDAASWPDVVAAARELEAGP